MRSFTEEKKFETSPTKRKRKKADLTKRQRQKTKKSAMPTTPIHASEDTQIAISEVMATPIAVDFSREELTRTKRESMELNAGQKLAMDILSKEMTNLPSDVVCIRISVSDKEVRLLKKISNPQQMGILEIHKVKKITGHQLVVNVITYQAWQSQQNKKFQREIHQTQLTDLDFTPAQSPISMRESDNRTEEEYSACRNMDACELFPGLDPAYLAASDILSLSAVNQNMSAYPFSLFSGFRKEGGVGVSAAQRIETEIKSQDISQDNARAKLIELGFDKDQVNDFFSREGGEKTCKVIAESYAALKSDFAPKKIMALIDHSGGMRNFFAVKNKTVALKKLGFTPEKIFKLANHQGGSNSLLAVIKHFAALDELQLTTAQIVKMASFPGGSKNLAAITAHFTALEEFGFTTEQIVKMVSNKGGSKNLVAVTCDFKKLNEFGLTIEQIFNIVNHEGGSNNVIAVTKNFKKLEQFGFSSAQIVSMVSYVAGSKNLATMIEGIDMINERKLTNYDLATMVKHLQVSGVRREKLKQYISTLPVLTDAAMHTEEPEIVAVQETIGGSKQASAASKEELSRRDQKFILSMLSANALLLSEILDVTEIQGLALMEMSACNRKAAGITKIRQVKLSDQITGYKLTIDVDIYQACRRQFSDSDIGVPQYRHSQHELATSSGKVSASPFVLFPSHSDSDVSARGAGKDVDAAELEYFFNGAFQ